MTSFGIRALLAVSGVVLLYVGAGTLFTPHAFFASSGAPLGTDPSLLSEVRAPGGMLILSGLIVGLGAFRRAMMRPALALAALVYGTFGLSRLVAIAFDGAPSSALVAALVLELIIGALALVALLTPYGRRDEPRLS